MGILQELKNEAQATQQSQQVRQAATQERREARMQDIGPKMQALYGFFSEMVDTVNTVHPDIVVDYDVPGFGVLRGLQQGEYEIDAAEPSRRFGVYFKCIVPDIANVPQLEKDIRPSGKQAWTGDFIRFRSKAFSPEDRAVSVEAYVAVSLKFKADADDNLIRLAIKNLQYIGKSTYSFEPDEITKELMEELAKCALRRPNQFHELSGDRISTEFRMRLKRGVEAHQREREQTSHHDTSLLKKAMRLFRRTA